VRGEGFEDLGNFDLGFTASTRKDVLLLVRTLPVIV
jgi:hypothetical protein